MTVSTSNSVVTYRGNGSATSFAVPFKVLDEDHLVVTRRIFATGVDDHTYIGTDYSYSGIGDSSGTLTLAGAALSDTYELIIERIVPYTQDLDIVNAGGFYPESVEEQLDLIVMGVQQVAAVGDRALKVPAGETAGPLSFTLDQLNEMVSAGYLLGTTSVASLIGYLPVVGADATDLQTTLRSTLPLTPEMFDPDAGTGGDDTAALRAMVAAVNTAGQGYIRFMPGKTYLLSHAVQETLLFDEIDGLLIEGYGATLKTADDGCPTSSFGYNWGQINFIECSNVSILGLTLDGNRAGQTHTQFMPDGVTPRPDGYGYNAGINIYDGGGVPDFYSDHILIKHCRLINHGVLSGTIDARGDGVFATSGCDYIVIEDNWFENVGRWAFALAEGSGTSTHIYFRRNRCLLGTRGAGYIPWGAVDIEDFGLNHSHIYICDNTFAGTSQIAIGGFDATAAEVTVSDVYIQRNSWRLPSAGGGADVPWSLGNSNPPPGTYRSLERLFIEDNVVSWAGVPATFHIGQLAKVVDAFIRRNIFRAETLTAASELGLQLANGGHLEGRIEITDNEFIGLGEGIFNTNSWYTDPSPAALHMRIERNTFRFCYRSFNLQMQGSAAPVGSTFVFRGNVSENSRAAAGGGAGETLNGGTPGITLYDVTGHEHINAHTNVTYGASAPLPPSTVAGIRITASAAAQNLRGFVTDASATTFASTVAGGGANKVPVVCDGTNWIIG